MSNQPKLTGPQERLLRRMYEQEILHVDGRSEISLEVLVELGFAEKHLSFAGKLTPLGRLEAERRFGCSTDNRR